MNQKQEKSESPFFSSLRVEDFFQRAGQAGYTTQQCALVIKNYYREKQSLNEISAVSRKFREYLAQAFVFPELKILKQQNDSQGNGKLAFQTPDGQVIESVFLEKKDGEISICISTQAGCRMGCAFCATGCLGLFRNLQTWEMVEQVRMTYQTFLKGKPLTHVTIMGMGEPMENFEAVYEAFRILIHPLTYMVGAEKITVASCGYLPGLEKLARQEVRPSLSISLHASNQELREQILPIARAYNLSDLVDFIRRYPLKKNKRLSLQYLLLKGVNDTPRHAEELADLLKGLPVKINFLRYNPVQGLPFEPSEEETRDYFIRRLRDAGISSIRRLSYGGEIKAACGQLGHELLAQGF